MNADTNAAALDELTRLIPETKQLSEKDMLTVVGLLRQSLYAELEEEAAAGRIIDSDDVGALRILIRDLPVHAPEEIDDFISDLNLPPEEAEIEVANWPYRHQSVRGELLVGQELVGFTLVRLKPYSYLLLTQKGAPTIAESFSRAFGQKPAAHSDNLFKVQGQVLVAWTWVLDPDPNLALLEAEHLRALWESTATA